MIMGSPPLYNNHVIQWVFDDKIKIVFPYERYDLWTNSFNIVREEVVKKQKQEVQLKLF